MARKKATKKKSRSGRKMGSVVPKRYQSDTMLAGGVVMGVLVARALPALINKVVPGANPKLVNGVQAALGIVGAVSMQRSPLLRGGAIGIASTAILDLATNIGLLPSASAVGADEVLINLDGVSGYGNGYPRNMVAGGGVGASFNDQNYANNLIAGALQTMGPYM